ncbi:MAG TPA: YfaZ family outer membrane protein [Steroidobacteraceae bacterium]|nr:YfaZ family outer membrane protein [Steroidobacteraceae bacterium]
MLRQTTQTTLLLSATLLLAAYSAQAQESQTGSHAEVQFSNDTLQMRYMADGDRVNVGANSQASAAFFLSEERDIVLSGDLLFPARFDFAPPLGIRFGPRAYAALLEDENNDVMALSVGAEARFTIHRSSGLAIAGHAFYAPDILTFGSADNLTDLGARVEISATPRLLVFGGMRWFEFDLTDGSGERTLQEELFVGAGWRF